jgi:DNA gyrase subunit A
MGRATQGVTLIAVGEGTTLSGVQRVLETDAVDGILADDDAEAAGDGADAAGDGTEGT